MVREAYRAVAERTEDQEGQEAHSEGDALTVCGGGSPGGQQLVRVHRLPSWPSGDCAVIVLAGHFRVIPEDDALCSGRGDEARPAALTFLPIRQVCWIGNKMYGPFCGE